MKLWAHQIRDFDFPSCKDTDKWAKKKDTFHADKYLETYSEVNELSLLLKV